MCASVKATIWLTGPDRFHGRYQQYQLMRCSNCSMVWLHAPPKPAAMGEHYGEAYDRVIATAAEAADHWLGRRDELFRYKSGGAVLDLGCGSGGFLSTLKGPSWKRFGIEMSQAAAATARLRSDAEVFVGDILDAPFPAGSFDAITCFNVFEHVYQPREVLARVAEWLKPGGIFYTLMPNIDSAGARIFRSYWYALELPRHLSHFSPATLRLLARSVDLQEVYVSAHRELFFESSFRYVIDDLLDRMGISHTPMALATVPSFPWRVIRAMFRATALPIFTNLAALGGDGETITAILKKADVSQ